MFSGIVEEMARVTDIYKYGENVDLTLTCSFASELKIDQSIAHNGVCLTVVKLDGEHYTVTAMKETLDRSNLGLLKVGDMVNVERSMMMNGRLDGHIVQGHVDQTAVCTGMEDAQGSTYFTFSYEGDAVIPYTRQNTNFKHIEVGTVVNLEFDILGKYIARLRHFENI